MVKGQLFTRSRLTPSTHVRGTMAISRLEPLKCHKVSIRCVHMASTGGSSSIICVPLTSLQLPSRPEAKGLCVFCAIRVKSDLYLLLFTVYKTNNNKLWRCETMWFKIEPDALVNNGVVATTFVVVATAFLFDDIWYHWCRTVFDSEIWITIIPVFIWFWFYSFDVFLIFFWEDRLNRRTAICKYLIKNMFGKNSTWDWWL